MATMDLRPMTLGEVLDRTFSLYKENFLLFAGIFAIPYLLVVIFSVVYSSLILVPAVAPGGSMTSAMAMQVVGGLLVTVVLFALVGLLIFASAQAATVIAVSDLYLGRSPGLAKSFVRVRGRIPAVLLAMVLIVLMLTGVVVAMGATMVPLIRAGSRSLQTPITLGMLIAVAAIVLGAWVLSRTAVAVPAAALESIGPAAAISRSFRLTKGSAGQIFTVYLLLFFLTILSAFIFQFPFLVAAGSPLKPHVLPIGMRILQGLASWISGVIVAPIGTIAFSLIYYNQRVRKEAFDLEKMMASLETGEAPPSPSVA